LNQRRSPDGLRNVLINVHLSTFHRCTEVRNQASRERCLD
jgi:hypothetical protein